MKSSNHSKNCLNEDLFSFEPQRTFNGDANEVAFLLGGIGTGNISIGARGELRDFEIFNRPGKGLKFPYTFFSIWMKEHGKEPIGRVLESRMNPPFSKSHGFNSSEVAGLPRFEKSSFKGEYPFAWVELQDEKLPVCVTLEAYTPFIPLNPEDSGIPCGILKYRIKNISENDIKFSIAGSLSNPLGFEGFDVFKNFRMDNDPGRENEYMEDNGVSGIKMFSSTIRENQLQYGSMAIATTDCNATCKPRWFEGGWFDGIQDFWDDFMFDGKLERASAKGGEGNELMSQKLLTGSLAVQHTLKPGEEKEVLFVLSWFFPNRVKNWNEDCCCGSCCSTVKTIKNNYANRFQNAWQVIQYTIDNLERLESTTRKFHDALFGSTLPDYVIDAVSSNITVMRSTTCFWLENGIFAAYEGCHDGNGCCDGTCTHVWNYAQTLAFLFPSLERSMRRTEFNIETDNAGNMAFRTHQIMDGAKWDFHPAADGQMGTIIRLYREWKISGDTQFLREVWKNAKKALEFAFTYWDKDGDYVLDSQQHNTYDIEFYGPNSLTNSMFFAALKAAGEMAEALGEDELAQRYRDIFEKGSKKMDQMLWNGKYYVQRIDDINEYKYQYGEGCLSDQVLGQFMAHVAGLGYVLPEENVKKSVKAIYDYNFKKDFTDHHNVQRTYILNNEKGLVLCSWPDGGRPRFPFVYSDEVWTGIEYQVATHLIYEGWIEEGLEIAKAVRERHDGYSRNPWNEVECGHHYARSMASWGLLTSLSGYRCDMVKGEIEFSPVVSKDNFTSFFSTGKAWGIFTQILNGQGSVYEYKIDVLYGDLSGVVLKANGEVITTL